MPLQTESIVGYGPQTHPKTISDNRMIANPLNSCGNSVIGTQSVSAAIIRPDFESVSFPMSKRLAACPAQYGEGYQSNEDYPALKCNEHGGHGVPGTAHVIGHGVIVFTIDTNRLEESG